MIAIIRALSWLSARLSQSQVQCVGRVLGWLLGSGLRFRRSEVQATLQRCFPEKSPADVRVVADGMYRHLGVFLIEGLRTGHMDLAALAEEVDFSGFEKGLQILSQGHGLIVLTAHVGNFELLAMMAALKGAPLTVITKALKPKWLNDWWLETRGKFGVKMLPARDSYRYCREVLKANRILGFILDQNMKRNRGIFVDYFGRPACTSPGLALLSAQTGAPVLPVFMLREPDGRHRLHVFDPLPPPERADKEAIRQATQAYTAIIERFVRAHPDQWIWLHRRWRTQPLEGMTNEKQAVGCSL
ncbi:MAG: lysophospholipid acyltransferase family protein [Verrucomicrobia bacterium]|nr:lysophospholipid acyltransferase family protein [Verrucomicrobiota bacterium]